LIGILANSATGVNVDKSREELKTIAESYGVGEYHRHVMLCLGPDCCTPDVGEAAWLALKKELKERGLSLGHGPKECFRTKANCLRICQGGPIMVVYPEGTWYARMTAERIPLFVQQHLVEEKPVEEWIFTHNQLPNRGE
jgi:(2Fe-2S) ferredoxin